MKNPFLAAVHGIEHAALGAAHRVEDIVHHHHDDDSTATPEPVPLPDPVIEPEPSPTREATGTGVDEALPVARDAAVASEVAPAADPAVLVTVRHAEGDAPVAPASVSVVRDGVEDVLPVVAHAVSTAPGRTTYAFAKRVGDRVWPFLVAGGVAVSAFVPYGSQVRVALGFLGTPAGRLTLALLCVGGGTAMGFAEGWTLNGRYVAQRQQEERERVARQQRDNAIAIGEADRKALAAERIEEESLRARFDDLVSRYHDLDAKSYANAAEAADRENARRVAQETADAATALAADTQVTANAARDSLASTQRELANARATKNDRVAAESGTVCLPADVSERLRAFRRQ